MTYQNWIKRVIQSLMKSSGGRRRAILKGGSAPKRVREDIQKKGRKEKRLPDKCFSKRRPTCQKREGKKMAMAWRLPWAGGGNRKPSKAA